LSNQIEELEAQIFRSLLKFSKKYNGLAIACSSGIDSTVLFYVIYGIIKKKNIKINLAICHFNFWLRDKESGDDELFLRQLAITHGVEFICHNKKQLPEATQSESLQMWARRLRYDFFEEIIEKNWLIVLGHHKEDLTENIILRLCRGVSPMALSGMSCLHKNYWRPFLKISKKHIASLAERHKLPYREDSSNATMKYKRNIVRLEIVPLLQKINPQAMQHILTFNSNTRDLLSFALEKINPILNEFLDANNDLKLQIFLGYNTGVKNTILAIFLKRNNCDPQKLSSRILDLILKKIEEKIRILNPNPEIKEISMPEKKILYITKQKLTFTQPPKGPKSLRSII
jgi:tRNA(Ile)-lysidine synthase